MSSSSGGGSRDKRPPQRVYVHHFPKQARGPSTASPSGYVRTVTLTMPEIQVVPGELDGDSADRLTEPELHLEEAAGKKGSPRSGKAAAKKQPRRVASPDDITDKGTDPRHRSLKRHHRELSMKGHRLFERGKLQEARRVLESVVAEQPEDPFPHTMLGTVYLALGAADRALALFEAALTLDPDDLAARVYRGEIQLNRGKKKAGLKDLHHAVELGAKEDPFVQRARRLIRRAEAPAAR